MSPELTASALRRGLFAAAVLAGSTLGIAPAGALELTLTAISIPFNNEISLDYYEPGNNVVASVFFPTGNPRNFEILKTNGTRVPLSGVAGLQGEINIASARSAARGGFAGSPFSAGTVFASTGLDGEILRINPDGTAALFVNLPGDNNGKLDGALHVDRTGVWGGELIATTTEGQVWRVDGAGNATLIATIPGVQDLEAAITIPNDPARYGGLAGKILASDEFSNKLFAIGADGSVQSWTTSLRINDIDMINANENFFGNAFGAGRILGAGADQFADNIGDIMVVQEGNFLNLPQTILGLLKWDFLADAPVIETVDIAAGSPTINGWEEITFAPAGIREIAPIELPVAAVPEPSTLLLLGFGLIGAGALRRPARAV